MRRLESCRRKLSLEEQETSRASEKGTGRHFKQRGEDAVSKELSQLHLCDTFEPLHSKDLNNEQRKEVLESHLFL
jgi:hypothetical protein